MTIVNFIVDMLMLTIVFDTNGQFKNFLWGQKSKDYYQPPLYPSKYTLKTNLASRLMLVLKRNYYISSGENN
jgi:hypothetical protein